jgi:hypothetical protein
MRGFGHHRPAVTRADPHQSVALMIIDLAHPHTLDHRHSLNDYGSPEQRIADRANGTGYGTSQRVRRPPLRQMTGETTLRAAVRLPRRGRPQGCPAVTSIRKWTRASANVEDVSDAGLFVTRAGSMRPLGSGGQRPGMCSRRADPPR